MKYYNPLSLIAPFIITIVLLTSSVCLAQNPGVTVVFEPREEAVISARVPSVILKIKREFGQKFKAGQILVELDPIIYRLKSEKAAAQLEEARMRYQVNQQLYEDKRASKLEVEEARRDFLVAEKQYALSRQLLARCRVKAPFTGRVRKVLAHQGEMVEEGEPLAAIVNDSSLLAKFLLPSQQFANISLGGKVSIRVNETGDTVIGKISHISAVIDPGSHTLEVFALVPNKNGRLRSGMTGFVLTGL